eukprot:5346939-Amphidinium_carterae.1
MSLIKRLHLVSDKVVFYVPVHMVRSMDPTNPDHLVPASDECNAHNQFSRCSTQLDTCPPPKSMSCAPVHRTSLEVYRHVPE